ncbi:MAG: hypothetical protein JWO86_4145, partial [Myxococcaceae bacterium]|nr:hypothetical protein [Myxococcaceae bacterium]
MTVRSRALSRARARAGQRGISSV